MLSGHLNPYGGNVIDNTARSRISVVNARIDNIIANTSSTEGNSELIDIRTGADNKVYSTAGDAVRAQFTRTNDIILRHTGHANLFDKTKFTPGCEFKVSTRTVIPNDKGYGLSDFIPVQFGKTLYFSRSGASSNTTYIYGFNEGKDFVTGSNSSNINSYLIPPGVCYIRICIKTETINDFQIEYDSVSAYKDYIDMGMVSSQLPNITNTVSRLDNIVNESLVSRNLFDKNTWLSDSELDKTTGQPISNNKGYGVSGFIPVQQGDTIAFSVNGSAFSVTFVYAFTSSQTYISRTSNISTYSVPNGVSYIRVCIFNSEIEKFQVEQTTVTEYVPYAVSSDDLFTTIQKVKDNFPGANPLSGIENTPGLISCFLNVGCIGDSLASGVAVYKDQSGNIVVNSQNRYQYSWGQYLARMTGNTYYNWSAGGLRTDSWLNSAYATECFDGEHLCQAYIIGLGQNDNNKNHGSDLGTINDINTANYNNNADTFYGRYAKIIQKIKEVQPKAKIFVITDPNDSVNTNGYNTAIRNIAQLFDNVYVLDMRAYWSTAPCNEFLENQKRYGHFNAVGYYIIAKMIMTYIDYIMEHNYEDFREIENIGTDYHWYE